MEWGAWSIGMVEWIWGSSRMESWMGGGGLYLHPEISMMGTSSRVSFRGRGSTHSTRIGPSPSGHSIRIHSSTSRYSIINTLLPHLDYSSRIYP
jgi:hypothetical protein